MGAQWEFFFAKLSQRHVTQVGIDINRRPPCPLALHSLLQSQFQPVHFPLIHKQLLYTLPIPHFQHLHLPEMTSPIPQNQLPASKAHTEGNMPPVGDGTPPPSTFQLSTLHRYTTSDSSPYSPSPNRTRDELPRQSSSHWSDPSRPLFSRVLQQLGRSNISSPTQPQRAHPRPGNSTNYARRILQKHGYSRGTYTCLTLSQTS